MNLARPLAAVALPALLIGGGVFAWTQLNGGDESSERPLVTAPVERRTLRQSIVTRGTVAYPAAGELLAAAPGRVTGVATATGETVAAGSTLLFLDGRPTIAIPGSLPFWRDLEPGDSGEDVRQLETALQAEGLNPGNVDETFTFTTGQALRAWQEEHGFPVDGVFRISDAAPGAWPARTGAIRAKPGDFVARGQSLMAFTALELQVLADLAPTQRVRVREGLPVSIEVTGSRKTARGTLGAPREATPQASIPGAAAAPEQTTYVAPITLTEPIDAVDGAQVQVTLLLAEVPDALVVPLAAIVMDGAGSPSVQVQDGNGQVRLVPVTTGLSEGAFIQVLSGLSGGDMVLLEQR